MAVGDFLSSLGSFSILQTLIMTSFSPLNVQTAGGVFVLTFLAVKLATMVINRKRYRLPPGPRGLPIVGYLPFFGKNPADTFNKLRKMYGDIISIRMGSWPAVVINGYDVIKEALVTKGDDFSGRPQFLTAELLNGGRSLSFSIFGPVWKAHRKIVSNVLYTFTNSRNNPTEDIIRTEVDTITEEFLAHGDDSFCPLHVLDEAVASIIFQLCYGQHQNIRDDKDFMYFLTLTDEFSEFTNAGNPVDVMPWLRRLMPWKVTQMKTLIDGFERCRDRKVKERATTYSENALRDMMDGLIHAGDNLTSQECELGLNKERIVETLDTLFGASIETTNATLQWFVCLMAAYPDTQEKIVQQINEVVGQGRQPQISDRSSLPLIDATVYEVLRFGSILPFSLPHATLRDTTLKGYDIPEGTVVLVNLWSVSKDEELWGDPDNFRPERFLNPEDGTLNRDLADKTSAFSLGRRRCLGESLARMELFLLFAVLLHRVKIYKPPGHSEYTMAGKPGLSRLPVPYDICVAPRA